VLGVRIALPCFSEASAGNSPIACLSFPHRGSEPRPERCCSSGPAPAPGSNPDAPQAWKNPAAILRKRRRSALRAQNFPIRDQKGLCRHGGAGRQKLLLTTDVASVTPVVSGGGLRADDRRETAVAPGKISSHRACDFFRFGMRHDAAPGKIVGTSRAEG